MCKFYVAKLLFLQKSAWNICVIQKKGGPLHAFFAVRAHVYEKKWQLALFSRYMRVQEQKQY